MTLPKHVVDQAATVTDNMHRAHRLFKDRNDLNALGKQQRAARIYTTAKQQMAALAEKAKQDQQARTDELQRQVFGIDDIAGSSAVDRAAASMSYRDALGRAAQAVSPDAAKALLQQAKSSGDELLARAVAQDAFNRPAIAGMGSPWLDVVDAYSSTRPHVQDALTEMHQTRLHGSDPIRDAMTFYVSKPSEISNLSDYQITQLANGEN